jgi:hypothetical protein
MLRNAKNLHSFELRARDGVLGKVKDMYFDDLRWNIRYLVVETGAWLKSRKVLISTAAIVGPDWDSQKLNVDLTKEEVRNSPTLETERPVSREQEGLLNAYYGWPNYWTDTAYAPDGLVAGVAVVQPISLAPGVTGVRGGVAIPGPTAGRVAPDGDPSLRSANEVSGYHIEATDGTVGHLEDFLVDDQSWAIRYGVIDTRNWLPGKRVIIAPDWISRVRWSEKSVYIDLTRERIKGSPEYDPKRPFDSAYGDKLHTYYDRPQSTGW